MQTQAAPQLTPEESVYELPEIWNETWFSPDDQQRIERITKEIPNEVRTLLDAGCGNGMFLHYLRDNRSRLERLCGVERSKSALAHVKTEKCRASLEEMPFSDNEFDLVSSLEVLEHLPVGIYQDALQEISRIAKRYILITVPYAQDLSVGMTICPKCLCRFNANYHVRSFTEATLRPLFDKYGFECQEIFHLRPRKVMHRPVARAVDYARLTKHRVFGYGRAYPACAVCPACGFQDTEKPLGTQGEPAQGLRPGSVRSILLNLLRFKPSYRWVGVLFKLRGER